MTKATARGEVVDFQATTSCFTENHKSSPPSFLRAIFSLSLQVQDILERLAPADFDAIVCGAKAPLGILKKISNILAKQLSRSVAF